MLNGKELKIDYVTSVSSLYLNKLGNKTFLQIYNTCTVFSTSPLLKKTPFKYCHISFFKEV